MLAPVVEKHDKGPYPWRLHAAGIDPWHFMRRFARKRDAVVASTHSAFFQEALAAAERAGAVCIAPGPEPACGRHDREPFCEADRSWPECSEPIHALGNVTDLASFRLGWAPERWMDSLLGWSSFCDEEAQKKAWLLAVQDLASGNLTEAEETVLGATSKTRAYLRLSEGAREFLARRLYGERSQEPERLCSAFEAV